MINADILVVATVFFVSTAFTAVEEWFFSRVFRLEPKTSLLN